METIAPLVRAVVRAFYPDKFAVVVEPLLREPYYLEDDETPTGPLSKKFAGLSATSIRRVLGILEKHSLVQRKEILTENNEEDANKEPASRETKVRRYYYYIDWIMFIKIISLRLEQMRQHIGSSQGKNEIVNIQFTCSNCEAKCDMLRASRLDFSCEECGCPLVEMEQPAAAGEKAMSKANADALSKKFSSQITAELDQRDGIVELLRSAQNLGPRIPLNDPAVKLREIARERRHLQQLQSNNREALPESGEALAVVASSSNEASEMATWLQKTVTGELTEDAMRDIEERELKRARTENAGGLDRVALRNREDDYAAEYERQQLAQLEALKRETENTSGSAAVGSSNKQNLDRVFLFKDGSSIRAGDISNDNIEELHERCVDNDEFEAFVSFLKEYAGWEV